MFERIRVQNIQIVTFLNFNHCTSLYYWYVKISVVVLYFEPRYIIFKKYDSIFKLDFVLVKVEIVAIDLGTNYFIFLSPAFRVVLPLLRTVDSYDSWRLFCLFNISDLDKPKTLKTIIRVCLNLCWLYISGCIM